MNQWSKPMHFMLLLVLPVSSWAVNASTKKKAPKAKVISTRITLKGSLKKEVRRSVELPQAVADETPLVVKNIQESFLSEEFQRDMEGRYLSKRHRWEANNANYAAVIHDRQGRPFAYSQTQESEDGREMAQSFKKYALDKGVRNFMNSQKETRPLVKTVEAVENAAKVEVVTDDNWKISSGLNPLNARTFVSASRESLSFTLDSTLNLYTQSEAPDYAISSRLGLGRTASEMNLNSTYNFSKEYQAASVLNLNSSVMRTGVTRYFSQTLSTTFDTFYGVAGAPSPDQVAQVSLNYQF